MISDAYALCKRNGICSFLIKIKKVSFPSDSSEEIPNIVAPFWSCRYVADGSFEVYRC